MNRDFIEAVIKGQNPETQVIVDSIPDVPDPFKQGVSVPAWAGTFGFKRRLFALLFRMNRVKMWAMYREGAIVEYKVAAPFFKGWSFAVTPELLFLASNISNGIVSTVGHNPDILFEFRERKFFVPGELIQQFIHSIYFAAQFAGARIISIKQACEVKKPDAEEEDTQEGKELRVLH